MADSVPPGEPDDVKYLDAEEFRQKGYLQELNRRFLHPLGLALSINVDDDGRATGLGGIWDYRDDPEGMAYGPHTMSEEKFVNIESELHERAADRVQALGYFIQPITDPGVEFDEGRS